MRARYLLPTILVPASLVLASPALAKPIQSARSKVTRPPAVAWVFAIKDDRQGNPHGQVFLRVAGRRVLVSKNASGHYHVLSRSEYHAHGVPSAAITACTGWWAGQGEDVYVIRRPGRLHVYARELDESAPLPAPRLVKTIPVR